MKIFLASPRGFCAGVVRAIETVMLNLYTHGSPVYVLHEIVHNKHVIKDLEQEGAIFVERLQDVPKGKICIFSAHGVSKAIEQEAVELGLETIDATCPLVSSVHKAVEKYCSKSFDVIIIGHHKHPEVEATAGRVNAGVHIVATVQEAKALTVTNPDKVAYVTQTTLSHDDIGPIREVLVQRFPGIRGQESNICFATQNRQDAVREIAELSELVFVVGSKNSSNSNRLREVAEKTGTEAYLIDDAGDIDKSWLKGKKSVGITAGASAPEGLVQGVIGWLSKRYFVTVEEIQGQEEKVYFKPAEIQNKKA